MDIALRTATFINAVTLEHVAKVCCDNFHSLLYTPPILFSFMLSGKGKCIILSGFWAAIVS